jgi:MFS family permease
VPEPADKPADRSAGNQSGNQAEKSATFRDVFVVSEFRALWLAYLASVAGDQLALVAVTVLVYDRTKSPLLTALAYSAGFLPWAVGGITLSRLADRYPRRTVMVTCDSARLVIVALMAVPAVPLYILVLLLAVVTLLDSPFRAARSAMLPDILTGDRYVMATATMQITNRTGRTLGLAGGGIAVAAIGAHAALAADAATFAFSALLVRFGVKLRPVHAKEQQKHKEQHIVTKVFTNPRLRTLMLLGWLVPFYAVPEGVAAPYAHLLHGGSITTGLILAAGPAGGIVGSVTFSRLVQPDRRQRYMGPLAVAACAILALCFARPPLIPSLLIFAAATVCSCYQLAANSAFVKTVPPSWRGQAFGLANGGINVGQSAWFAAAGAAASALSPAVVIGLSGLIGAVVALSLAVSWRRLPVAEPEPAIPLVPFYSQSFRMTPPMKLLGNTCISTAR